MVPQLTVGTQIRSSNDVLHRILPSTHFATIAPGKTPCAEVAFRARSSRLGSFTCGTRRKIGTVVTPRPVLDLLATARPRAFSRPSATSKLGPPRRWTKRRRRPKTHNRSLANRSSAIDPGATQRMLLEHAWNCCSNDVFGQAHALRQQAPCFPDLLPISHQRFFGRLFLYETKYARSELIRHLPKRSIPQSLSCFEQTARRNSAKNAPHS